MINIKIFLKKLRKKQWLTQEQFAKLLWVSHISLALIESWWRNVTKKFIEKLSSYLDIPPIYLSFFMFNEKYISKNDKYKTSFFKIGIWIHRLTDQIFLIYKWK